MKAIALAACLALIAGAGGARAEPALAGTYEGIIWSAGEDLPGQTTFAVAADGTIAGAYVFIDGDTPASGTLSGCTLAAPILRCKWRDLYGAGLFVVRFSPDFARFEGSWYDPGPRPQAPPEGGYPWSGVRAAS